MHSDHGRWGVLERGSAGPPGPSWPRLGGEKAAFLGPLACRDGCTGKLCLSERWGVATGRGEACRGRGEVSGLWTRGDCCLSELIGRKVVDSAFSSRD